jgi:photosystem II stability/assembly factor-like uncharacterized protein
MTSQQSVSRRRRNPFARLGKWSSLSFVLFLVLVLASPVLQAQQRIPGDWIGLGPEGGEVVALAPSAAQVGLVWAAVHDGGVFKSTDGGETWEPARGGLEALSYLSLAADPADPDRAYLGTSQGLWQTTDGGETWTRNPLLLGFGLSSIGIQTVVVAPSDPDVLYASSSVELRKSTDRGRTWQRIEGFPYRGASRIVFDPQEADTAYFLVRVGNPWKTTDGGASFTELIGGTEGGLTEFNRGGVLDVAVSNETPDLVYLSVSSRTLPGIYRSVDGGVTWTFVNTPLEPTVSAAPEMLALDPTDDQRLITAGRRGLFTSSDGGETWAEIDLATISWNERRVFTAQWLADMPGTALVGTESGGVFRSDDGAATWSPSSTGLNARPLGIGSLLGNDDSSHPGLVVDPRWTGRLYALSRDFRLYGSSDWGLSWARLDGSFAEGSGVIDVRLDPSRPDVLFARVLVADDQRNFDEILYRSRDAGLTWTEIGQGLPNPTVGGFDTHSPIHWNRDAPSPLLILTDGDVYRSTDDGGTWSVLYADLPELDNASPSLSRLAVSQGGQRLFLWLDVLSGDPCQGADCPEILERRLYESQDGGDSWTELDPVAQPTGRDTEFVAQGEIGVLYQIQNGDLYRSADSGASYSFFAPTPYEALGSRPVDGWPVIEVEDPTYADVIYQARFGWPVRRMVDNVWQNLSAGLPPVEVGGLVLVPWDTEGPRNLLVVTDSGLWARPLEASQFPPPAGEAITDPAFPDFRFWFRIDPGNGGPAIAGQKESQCLPGTVCASGAVAGRVEVLARVVGPRPNGFLWPTLVKFTTSEVQVWIQQISTEELRHYVLPRSEPTEGVLDGLFDRTGFTPDGSSKLSGSMSRDHGGPPPAGAWLTTPEIPGFRFKVAIGAQGTLGNPEGACLAETLCASGALPGRTEVLVRVVGPRPNGFLWPTMVKLTPAPVEVWIERTATGEIQHYELPGAAAGSDVLTGRFDREGFPEA